jgi:hypothetical protein
VKRLGLPTQLKNIPAQTEVEAPIDGGLEIETSDARSESSPTAGAGKVVVVPKRVEAAWELRNAASWLMGFPCPSLDQAIFLA